MTGEKVLTLLIKYNDDDTADIKTIKELVNVIYDAYEAELKNKEEKHGDELQALLNDMGRAISKLSGELKAKDARIEAQSSVIIACQNAILQKDERIEELEARVEKMKCCENCNFYPPQKCSFNTQYGCLDGLIPSDWKIKGTNNE